ncbi:MAG: hypothetical protein KUG81_06225 [Gammaproteobacteria bacterium]|nr:hypothetical protein [Gammaproteobacteria bacterium]
MTRRLISCLFIISLLFVGLEGAMDSVAGEHPHDSDSTQLAADTGDIPSIDIDGDSGHCQHCHHASANCISDEMVALHFPDINQQRFSLYSLNITNSAQAPPTPPPNA